MFSLLLSIPKCKCTKIYWMGSQRVKMLDDDDDGVRIFSINDDSTRSQALQNRPTNAGVLSFHSGTEEALILHVESATRNCQGFENIYHISTKNAYMIIRAKLFRGS